MNMANSIIGAGIIGQAYAVSQAGLVGGIALLVVLTIVIDWTLRLMVINSKLTGMKTYQATVQYCFGFSGLAAVSLAQGAFAFGGSVAFCVIIGDTVPPVIAYMFPKISSLPVLNLLTQRLPVIFLMVFCISYPLALQRNITALAKASTLALVSMIVIVITVAVRGPMVAPPDAHMSLSQWTINSSFFQAVAVISFAFVCHHNTLLIYDSLRTPTLDRFAKVTHLSTAVSMIACIVIGVCGFLSFKDKTQGNILNNFPAGDLLANIARFCFGFNMVTTLPLEVFVCREVIQECLGETKNAEMRHAVITTSLVLTAMVISFMTCNLGAILELVGSSSACVMAYILPPLCYLKLTNFKKLSFSSIAPYACIFFGALVMVISTFQSLYKITHEASHCSTRA